MKNNTLLLLILCYTLFSCSIKTDNNPISDTVISDNIYQYSVFTALANKIYDGTVCVADVKEKGNIGLGTFNGLNGEMIVCDGVVYQWLANGSVQIPDDQELVPFAVVTFFEADKTIELANSEDYNHLKTFISSQLPSNNIPYAFKIKADFKFLKCGSADKQKKPYSKTLSDALIDRPTFDIENTSGTLVGFWYPEYIGKVNVAGFHLHFISDDKTQAGHVMEFKASNLNVEIDYCSGFEIELPETNAFKTETFDLTQEYTNKK